MVKSIFLWIIAGAIPVFFLALMLSSARYRVIELRRRCREAAQRAHQAFEQRESRLREAGGGDVLAKELKDALEHLLQEPTQPMIAEEVLRLVQKDRSALEQAVETSRPPEGHAGAIETLHSTQTGLEQAARQGVESAQAFERATRRFPTLLFASAGR